MRRQIGISRRVSHSWKSIVLVAVLLMCMTACGRLRLSPTPGPAVPKSYPFQGTWTATGVRHTISLGEGRHASIADLTGSLFLEGPSRPSVGFRAEALILNDSATEMIGRAVWVDQDGDEIYSELRGQGTAASNKILCTFLGGTGRYAGAIGMYEFSWRFMIEADDGTVEGQSVGLKGTITVLSQAGSNPRGSGK